MSLGGTFWSRIQLEQRFPKPKVGGSTPLGTAKQINELRIFFANEQTVKFLLGNTVGNILQISRFWVPCPNASITPKRLSERL